MKEQNISSLNCCHLTCETFNNRHATRVTAYLNLRVLGRLICGLGSGPSDLKFHRRHSSNVERLAAEGCSAIPEADWNSDEQGVFSCGVADSSTYKSINNDQSRSLWSGLQGVGKSCCVWTNSSQLVGLFGLKFSG